MNAAPAHDEVLPLQSLYLHLVHSGFPLSARDYLDALRAIRAGHGAGRREDLHTLLRHLWARGDEDLVRLDEVFRRFARPSADDVRTLTDTGAGTPSTADASDPQALAEQALADTTDADATQAPGGPDGADAPRAEFAAAGEAGLGLPSARAPRPASRPYVFEPRLPLAERSLVIAMRRLRRAQREGPPVELDVDATVAEQCRSGWMLQPVMVPARRNQARLLVLVDASPSMLPWRGLFEPLAEALRQSRLAQATLLFFDNDPRDGLYGTARLEGFCDARALLRDTVGDRALMVISDAGCARGRGDRSRLAGMRSFVASVRQQCCARAWLNPLPAARWGAAGAALRPAGAMFELSDDGLTQAMDHLRGLKRG